MKVFKPSVQVQPTKRMAVFKDTYGRWWPSILSNLCGAVNVLWRSREFDLRTKSLFAFTCVMLGGLWRPGDLQTLVYVTCISVHIGHSTSRHGFHDWTDFIWYWKLNYNTSSQSSGSLHCCSDLHSSSWQQTCFIRFACMSSAALVTIKMSEHLEYSTNIHVWQYSNCGSSTSE